MDVFISYSRKDKEQAEVLCGALAEAGVDYWIDRSEIHGSANFLTEITRNIKACKVLIFIASANSAAAEFTQKEILYALKRKKPIIPYKIGEFQFEDNDELDFVFTNVQWVESLEEVVKSLEKQGLTHKAQPQPVEQPTPDPQPKPAPRPKPTQKSYKVGDYYDDGTKKGVVFEVTPDGKHGKIVSLEEAELSWSNEIAATGAKSSADGVVNMKVIQAIKGWRKQYPAFAWCAKLGKGWYLPAVEELSVLSQSVKTVNKELERQGVRRIITSFFGDSDLWSSTEKNWLCAWTARMSFLGGSDGSLKRSGKYVRAVAKF